MSGSSHLAAIILAAGASRRMGRNKALLPFRGGTFLSELAGLFASSCATVIAVLPPSGMACPDGVLCTVNPAPERGMLTSLQCGLRAAPPAAGAVFFTPVDLPAVKPSTVSALAGAAALIAIPRSNGRRGHPVLIQRSLIPEFLAAPHSAQARDIIERHEAEVRYVDVDDPGILADVDEPADYERLLAAEERR